MRSQVAGTGKADRQSIRVYSIFINGGIILLLIAGGIVGVVLESCPRIVWLKMVSWAGKCLASAKYTLDAGPGGKQYIRQRRE
jgi:hypothetical protein